MSNVVNRTGFRQITELISSPHNHPIILCVSIHILSCLNRPMSSISQWVISSMLLEGGVGVNNQMEALTLTLWDFKIAIGLKLGLNLGC